MLTLILTCVLLLIVYLNTLMVAMTVSVKGKGIKKHPENLRNIFGAVQPSPPNIKTFRIIFVNVRENFKVCRIKKTDEKVNLRKYSSNFRRSFGAEQSF